MSYTMKAISFHKRLDWLANITTWPLKCHYTCMITRWQHGILVLCIVITFCTRCDGISKNISMVSNMHSEKIVSIFHNPRSTIFGIVMKVKSMSLVCSSMNTPRKSTHRQLKQHPLCIYEYIQRNTFIVLYLESKNMHYLQATSMLCNKIYKPCIKMISKTLLRYTDLAL